MSTTSALLQVAREASPPDRAAVVAAGQPMTADHDDAGSVAGVTRPLRIADIVGADGDAPVATPVTLAELARFEPTTLFESPVWLRAYGIGDLVALSPGRRDGSAYPLLFAVRDRHLVHLGNLRWFEAACIEYLADLLLAQSGVDFIVFEDVRVDGALSRPAGTSVFRYQRNWQIVLNGPEADDFKISKKARRDNRRKRQAMEKEFADVRVALEEHPSRDLLEKIVALNRTKIETTHRRHAIDARELDRQWAIVSEIGRVVTVRDGARLVAGGVICVVGSRAFYVMTGYDMAASRYSPGVIAHNFAIEHCRQQGLFDFNIMWGDGVYKRRLGAKPRELATLVVRRSPAARFTAAYVRAVAAFHWRHFKARVKPLIRRQTTR